MKILGINKYHDGGIANVTDGTLLWSVEAQVNSNARHSSLFSLRAKAALDLLDDDPDAISYSGWEGTTPGYCGYSDDHTASSVEIVDSRTLRTFSCSHERAHIMCTYAMSPYEQGRRCYALLWEGTIGSIYLIDERLTIEKLATPVQFPGHRYSFIYELADPRWSDDSYGQSMSVAGKVMALAGSPGKSKLLREQKALVNEIVKDVGGRGLNKGRFASSPFYNIGVETDEFKSLARCLSDSVFEVFFSHARQYCVERLPLLVCGGCGLNCEWNTKWCDCGLFSGVFVPPCTDDTGVSIGAAIDAQRFYTGRAKLNWSVYSGEDFVIDCSVPSKWKAHPVGVASVASRLKGGDVIAWVQGKCEIGPRALGHRSILAAPFSRAMTDRLNAIKCRESYRPIAPVCRAANYRKYFIGPGADKYMLYFSIVTREDLCAVTHQDGSARVQTVADDHDALFVNLLDAFEELTGVGVLCNTSLNFPSCGFINTLGDLIRFVEHGGIDGVVVDRVLYDTKSI